jgi:glutamate dehydrogenase
VSDAVDTTSDVRTRPTSSFAGAARRLEAAKAELLGRAREDAERARGGDPAIGMLIGRYYRHTAPEDLVSRPAGDVLGAVVSHRRLAEHRPQGRQTVRVSTPTVADNGWECGHSLIEIVTDDMPFLVDSVTGYLAGQDVGVHLVIHPQLVVRRTLDGALLEVLDLDPTDPCPPDACVESWMHLEIDRLPAGADIARLESGVNGVLRDVRDAVDDWPKMRRRALDTADHLVDEPPAGLSDHEITDSAALLRWVADDHFTFLGYREYDLVGEGADEVLVAVPGTGLGILRADAPHSTAFARLQPEARVIAHQPALLVLTRANSRSTVHRSVFMDYVGVKKFDDDGRVVGERRFLGLYAASAYTQSVLDVPVLSRKIEYVLGHSGIAPESHDGKDVVQFFETYPREELFEIDNEELREIALQVLHLQERRQTRLFLRTDPFGRFLSAMVYLPRDRYTTVVRKRMEKILTDAYHAEAVDYTARVSESVLARLHFVVRVPTGTPVPDVDVPALEAKLSAATRSWQDEFADACLDQIGEENGTTLFKRYGESFPEAYKEDVPARMAVADAERLEALADDEPMALSLYEPVDADGSARRFKVYHYGELRSLSEMLPVLHSLGVEVVDERPYGVRRSDGRQAWINDFGLRFEADSVPGADTLKERFEDAFAAAWNGRLELDGFIGLVVAGGLTWRQVSVVQAYMAYQRQIGSMFSQRYTERVLLAHPGVVADLVALFETRFDPDQPDEDRLSRAAEISARVAVALDAIASLDDDRIVRSLLNKVQATLRTNYFQAQADGLPKPYTSFKVDPAMLPDAPLPRPRFEIWVHSPRVSGVHLRFGKVARGGLRWSDRREDFRTEVLGLVKAQMVKNAVIVPVGAKGGFVVMNPPDPSDREAFMAEGIACYRIFVSALLDITDNLVGGQVVPPPRVVRHDADDTYLVVAADKGTATFSDIANEISASYRFWLGDAFASGGSVGYDHKAMGITARGAWESVKRHFREMGIDTQSEDFTVVGVGDMSGDVFGNGMLLSEHIRLVAAFDHRHIFLDPDPDAAPSYAERRRLFDLPRSSWADYDASLISEGGGVHSRAAKSIEITPQVRERLGLPAGTTAMTPQLLMRAILSAPVQLLWNGGIGTYVKSAAESNADVGDKSNDTIRVDGHMLRAQVVGEGGNLGLTQLGRIEAARNGVRLNTDAIDNSAGVDTSDHEVNIKILLDSIVREGDLTEKQRVALLAEMTDDVGDHVLRDNYEQNILLGNARPGSASMQPVHQRFIRDLEARGLLNRDIEFLPSDAEIEARMSAGEGLTSPELAVLAAYSKITLTDDLLDTTLADEPWFASVLRSYFPPALVERYDGRLDAHPLRKEIITTVVANEMINRGGTSFEFRAQEEIGAAPVEIARAFTVAKEVFDLPAVWAQIEALDNKVPTSTQVALWLEARRLLDRATRWVLQSRGGTVDVEAEIQRFREPISRLAPMVPELLVGAERRRLDRRTDELVALGIPEDLAQQVAAQLDVFSLLDIAEIARRSESDPEEVARLYFSLSERFDIDVLLHRITMLPRPDRWASLARAALRSDLYAALAGLTSGVIRATPSGMAPGERIESWESQHAEGMARARGTLEEISALESYDLATISVALRTIRTLVAQGSG